MRVTEIITIRPDNDSCLTDQYNCSFDIGGLHDEEGHPIECSKFHQWQQEFKNAEADKDCTFDWNDFHKRGMELAKQLREKLPLSCDLWYSAPYKDKSGTIKGRILIL